MNLNFNIRSALYRCPRHKVQLVWAEAQGMLFWHCPNPVCHFCKPMKSGRRQSKGERDGIRKH